MQTKKENQHLILAGGGHSHILVLRYWSMQPAKRPEGLITLVSRHSTSIYSGMIPGLISHIYKRSECEIDLRKLCRLAKVSFIRAEITGLNIVTRELRLISETFLRPCIRWDLLSLDIGTESISIKISNTINRYIDTRKSNLKTVENLSYLESKKLNPDLLPIKPIGFFLDWLDKRITKTNAIVIGGGAAGVEVALALKYRWRNRVIQLRVLPIPGTDPKSSFKPSLNLGTAVANNIAINHIKEAGIELLDISSPISPNVFEWIIIVCAGSKVPQWLAKSGLPTGDQDRIITNIDLEVKGHPGIFASGDCGIIAISPRPASGVWAVRSSSILANNLYCAFYKKALKNWYPHNRSLQLLGQGKRNALAIWGPFAFSPNRFLWRLKEIIDRRFIRYFALMKSMQPQISTAKNNYITNSTMACRGCAAKLPSGTLESALRRLNGSRYINLDRINTNVTAEDAHVVTRTRMGSILLQSVDGFPALISDPWLNGRLTTLHACSDLWACGADVRSLQALVTLPKNNSSLQEELLFQTLEGIISVINSTGGKLIGGHTLENRDNSLANHKILTNNHLTPISEDLQVSLIINGQCPKDCFWPKGGFKHEDSLILSHPIGTGALFAAAMVNAAKPDWIDSAIEGMQQNQSSIVEILAHYSVNAATDITGFGLLGHLGEMLKASNPADLWERKISELVVNLDYLSIQTFPGVNELIKCGFTSTLALPNRIYWQLIEQGMIKISLPNSVSIDSFLEVLIDPQTCGPILISLPKTEAQHALVDLHANGFKNAKIIGKVERRKEI
uniref:Selenide, water dikinase n=1 Tax=Paulinella chromatophora TaxID=39717 RepID=B1X4P8_PAUCH|nr:hypothetical protein PCC_0479 [Paulinella chromatophora]ACB42917.1 hypothetical protein PCC_0479 [Paulinella chromatophora]